MLYRLNPRFTVFALSIVLVSGCPAPVEKPVASKADVPTNAGVTPPLRFEDALVEASCGECQLGMPGDGCHLAIRLEGKTFWVDGSGIDDHGDAHGESGLCNRIRQARITGLLANGRFVAEEFELLDESSTQEATKE